jgi:hypothetical protein
MVNEFPRWFAALSPSVWEYSVRCRLVLVPVRIRLFLSQRSLVGQTELPELLQRRQLAVSTFR